MMIMIGKERRLSFIIKNIIKSGALHFSRSWTMLAAPFFVCYCWKIPVCAGCLQRNRFA